MLSGLNRARAALAALAMGAGFAGACRAQQVAPVPAVDTGDRTAVIRLYLNYYLPENNVAPDWTGNVITGVAGTLSDAYLGATLRRLNYYRAMSGVGSKQVFGQSEDDMCQQAALMMAAEGNISHTPPPSWPFYTPAAAEACADSNIRLDSAGDEGPGAVDRFMADAETNNYYVGHRRWFIYPAEGEMGAGAVPPSNLSAGTAAIWILNAVPRPANAPLQTSWPPAGFVPAPLVFERWSFSYSDADFSGATVSVIKDGLPMNVQQEPLEGEFGNGSTTFVGDNTLVWEMPENQVGLSEDETYAVHVANVRINEVAQDFDYTVTSIEPRFSRISVTAPGPVAHRVGAVKGRFALSRTGDTSPPLTVAYQVGGTGVPGRDYRALTGTVTFQPGAAMARIPVVPLPGAGAIGPKTVTVSLVQGESYKMGQEVQAAVTIKK
jgi:hypothetical protein